MEHNLTKKLYFVSDYMEGAHPALLERLGELNSVKSGGYGLDDFSEAARRKIRAACAAPDAEIHFISGGTQANATVIGALLKSYQGVVAADTGHIATHEAGAVEHGGHKVLTLPHKDGKLSADSLKNFLITFWDDENNTHMVMPGMVYISHPTEFGTLYSKKELKDLSAVCKEYEIPLYLDGARLAYALACPENELSLEDLASLCDVFYIGGTKCGALFGEAVVVRDAALIPNFFTIIKAQGALLAKGMVAGIQFDTLFTDDLYIKLGKNAIDQAEKIRAALKEKGYEFAISSPTNQLFVILDDKALARLSEKVELSFWEKTADGRTVMRIATSWGTTDEDVETLINLL